MATNGSGVVHVPAGAGPVGGDGWVGAGVNPGSGKPGGSHPPLKQNQSGPGFIVVQGTEDVGGVAAGCTHRPPVQVQPGPGAGDAQPDPAARAAGCPGGTQPPLTHTQSGAGLTVRHGTVSGAGGGGDGGGGDGDAGSGGGGGGVEGGRQPPSTQVQPGPGGSPGQPVGGAVLPPLVPVVNARISDSATSDGFRPVAPVRATTRQK